MKTKLSLFSSCLLLACASSSLTAAPRDVQFRSVDFESSIVELHNFGEDTESLDEWRFCTHNENQMRRYSSASGLNGLSLAPGESLFVHYLGDAPADEANRINIPGSFALPLDRGPYGIQIYFPPISFGNGGTIADHVQWSIDGVGNTSAAERSDEAQSGGVWTNQGAWVATSQETSSILLTDASGAILHGPDNYEALVPVVPVVIMESSFDVDSVDVSASGEVTLTWTMTEGASYEVFRSTNLDNGADSFGEPVATVSVGSFIDPVVAEGTVFYRVTEISENPVIVIPSSFADIEGTSGGESTSLGDLSNTVQTVYNESVLLDSGLEVGDVLTGLSFRVGAGIRTTANTRREAPNFTVENYIIRLSTSNNSALDLSDTFADNRGDDLTVVRSGSLDFNAADYDDSSIALSQGDNARAPNAFGSVITFDTTFTYQGGDLLLEYTHTEPQPLNGSLVTSQADAVRVFAGLQTLFGAGFDATESGFSGGNNFATAIQFSIEP